MTEANKTRYISALWIVGVAILALLIGLWLQHNIKKNQQAKIAYLSATVLSQPRSIEPFKLTADDKKVFNNDNFKNHWSLVFFGFTHCPELCPTTLATLNQVYKHLQANQQQLPQVVFISVDPERDTPNKIKNYLKSFNPEFLGATGNKQQLDQLTQQFNVMYAKIVNSNDASNYSINHSGTILLVDPQGNLYAVFSTPHNADNIAKDLALITSHYQPEKMASAN